MVFGKREKIVAGGVIAAVLMAGLHFVLFSPRVQSYAKAAGEREAKLTELKNIKVADAKELDRLTSATTRSLDMLTSGVAALGMSENEVFIVELPVPPDPKVTPKPEDFEKNAAATRIKVEQQIPLLLEEVGKLQNYARASQAANATKLSFCDGPPTSQMWTTPQGWALPLALPQILTRDTGKLWDTLAAIEGIKGNLNSMTAGTASYNMRRVDYYKAMSALGVDYFYINGNTSYANQLYYGWPGTAYFGEFVPLIAKMALANVILDKIKEYEASNPPLIIHQKRLDRQFVFDVVDIDLTYIGMPLEGMKESKLYFMYEELRALNRILDTAMKLQVTNVTGVMLDGYAFLRQWAQPLPPPAIPADLTKLESDEASVGVDVSAPKAEEEDEENMDEELYGTEGGGEKKEGEEGGAAAGAPKAPPGLTVPRADELGVAVPIKITYQATNDKLWKFVYEIIRQQPMTELQRMQFRTLSQFPGFQNNANVEGSVTFVMVPKLFSLVDTVRKQLQALKTAPAPAAAAAPEQ